jgi:hypothetical protein
MTRTTWAVLTILPAALCVTGLHNSPNSNHHGCQYVQCPVDTTSPF